MKPASKGLSNNLMWSSKLTATSASQWGQRIQLLSKFFSVQLLVQAVNAVASLLMIRWLSKQQFAWFTIAFSLQTTFNLVTDCGINACLLAKGGECWKDRDALARLVATALRIRLRLAGIAALIILPWGVWLLLHNGASWLIALTLVLTVYGLAVAVSTTTIYGTVTRLHSRYRALQQAELLGAGARLTLLLSGIFVLPYALLALAANSVAQLWQTYFVKKQAAHLISLNSPADAQLQTEFTRMIRQQAPFYLYYAFQGQISVFVLSIFGSNNKVAELGALSRLGILATVLGSVINQLVAPAFARAQEVKQLIRLLAEACAATIGFGVAIIGATFLFGKQILWVLGSSYAHLNVELVWTSVSVVLGIVLSLLWAINTARGWLGKTWVMVPLTLLCQAITLRYFNLGSVRGVVEFSIVSHLPQLFVCIYLSLSGIRKLFLTMPNPIDTI